MRILKSTVHLISIYLFMNLTGCSAGNKVSVSDYSDRQSGYGAKIILETFEGIEYTGELIAVRDSVIFYCPEYGKSETDLANGLYPVNGINTKRITLIALEGNNVYLTGMLVMDQLEELWEPQWENFLLSQNPIFNLGSNKEKIVLSCVSCLGLTGIITGGLIASAGSTKKKIIYDLVDPSNIDYNYLKHFARYYDQEPDYIPALRRY